MNSIFVPLRATYSVSAPTVEGLVLYPCRVEVSGSAVGGASEEAAEDNEAEAEDGVGGAEGDGGGYDGNAAKVGETASSLEKSSASWHRVRVGISYRARFSSDPKWKPVEHFLQHLGSVC